MRVVVTGSSGHLGRAIIAARENGVDVVGYDRTPHPATATVGDIGDGRALRRAFEGADAVIHAAAANGGPGPEAVDRIERINVGGTEAVLEAALSAGVKRLIFTSTTAVYGAAIGRTREAAWVTEATDPEPQTVYERTKLDRSEEHTSELQSLMRSSYAVFCLQKKKKYLHQNST